MPVWEVSQRVVYEERYLVVAPTREEAQAKAAPLKPDSADQGDRRPVDFESLGDFVDACRREVIGPGSFSMKDSSDAMFESY